MENETILTTENYKKFLRKQTKVSMIIIRVCYIFLFAMALISLVYNFVGTDPELKGWGLFTYCIIMAVIFLLFDIFLIPINLKSTKTKNILNCKYHYVFNNNDFELTVTNPSGALIAQSKLNYETIYKVVFFENFIYIYINRLNAYMLDINCFKSEDDKVGVMTILSKYVNNKDHQKQF